MMFRVIYTHPATTQPRVALARVWELFIQGVSPHLYKKNSGGSVDTPELF
jgi:predicted secreted Zn-dependent protease